MLSRALILAAVAVMLGFLAESPAEAQNLEAGKPPAAIFSSTCSICHKSPRGLLKSVAPGSLPSFLRQHYTTSTDMASAMSAYVMSNGAANAAPGGGNLTKQGQDSRTAPKPEGEQASREGTKDGAKDGAKGRKPQREASRPDVDGLSPVPGGQDPNAAPEAAKPENAKPETKPENPKVKQKAAKGKPPKTEERIEPSQQAAREPPKEEPKPEPATRADPVPAVTPAPATPSQETAAAPPPVPAGPKTVDDLPSGPLTVDIQPAAPPPAAIAAAPAVPPAGPPVVPISQ
jgi:hypothetical protein